ncbi:hypothetical protein GH733_019307 [Mirounga leonina]|nr:hypothetical protein GH733_019307 [Mirounga leonina]
MPNTQPYCFMENTLDAQKTRLIWERGGAPVTVASHGVVGIFLLSALPLLCLELWCGILNLGVKDLMLLCGQIFLLLALLTLILSVTTSWLHSFKLSQVYLKEEEKNEKRQKLVRKKNKRYRVKKASRYTGNVLKPYQEMKLRKLRVTGETWKLSSGHKLGADEDLVLENESQTSSKTSNREATKKGNLPKPLNNFTKAFGSGGNLVTADHRNNWILYSITEDVPGISPASSGRSRRLLQMRVRDAAGLRGASSAGGPEANFDAERNIVVSGTLTFGRVFSEKCLDGESARNYNIVCDFSRLPQNAEVNGKQGKTYVATSSCVSIINPLITLKEQRCLFEHRKTEVLLTNNPAASPMFLHSSVWKSCGDRRREW